MNATTEKRSHCRNPARIPGAFRPLETVDRDDLVCSTIDISHGGLRLRSPGQPIIRKGDAVLVSIHCDEPAGLIDVQGQVRWLKKHQRKKDGWDMGVRLRAHELAKWTLWLEEASTIYESLAEV